MFQKLALFRKSILVLLIEANEWQWPRKDSQLNLDEFGFYLHPESYSEMNEVLAFELRSNFMSWWSLHYCTEFEPFSIIRHNLWVIYISYWQFCFTVVIRFGSELKLIEELDTDGDALLRTVFKLLWKVHRNNFLFYLSRYWNHFKPRRILSNLQKGTSVSEGRREPRRFRKRFYTLGVYPSRSRIPSVVVASSSLHIDLIHIKSCEDEDVKVVPMEEDDFNDPEENKNEFKTPTFTSEWLENEKYTFKKIRDKNGDGYLGKVWERIMLQELANIYLTSTQHKPYETHQKT